MDTVDPPWVRFETASGGLATYCCPCGPHRRCHRCRSKAGWRDRQVLSGCKRTIDAPDRRVNVFLLLDGCTFRRLWRATHRLGHPLEAVYAACRIDSVIALWRNTRAGASSGACAKNLHAAVTRMNRPDGT